MADIKINEDISEVFGALIGDGCLSRYKVKGRKNPMEVVLFTGHLINDFDYYKDIVCPIFIKKFKTKGYLYKRKSYNCVRYSIYNKKAFSYFKNLNFPIGKKLSLIIPRAILRKNKNATACVRGIFNTDGSIYKRYSKKYKNHSRLYNYLVIQFKMNSEEVMKQIKHILENNGIKTTKITKIDRAFVLRITDQEHINKFIKIIKPSNKYHMGRYLNSFNSRLSNNGLVAQLG